MIPIAEMMLVMFGAIAIDIAFGDPKNRYHPTAWMGCLMASIIPLFAGRGHTTQKLGGVITVCVVSCVALFAIFLLYQMIDHLIINIYDYIVNAANHLAYDTLSMIIYVLAGCILLKYTIAIRGMQVHAAAVTDALGESKMTDARTRLSMIVKRNTAALDQPHIISGTLESIGENITDGVTGSLFYFGLFGIFGAFAHRVTSTADSMIGYKNHMLARLGWFAAYSDTVMNYVPARLTGLAMVAAAFLLRYDWRASYHTMLRDKNHTDSRNSGYTMAALAGALNVKLEKKGEYALGADFSAPVISDVGRAISLMKATVLVFAICFVLPLGIASMLVASVIFAGGV